MVTWKNIFPKENRYFETNNGILYCGDCLEIMKKFPKKSIDLVIADPPYFLGNKPFENKKKKYKRVVERWDNQWKTKEEYLDWCGKWICETKNILIKGGSVLVFGTFHNAMNLKILLEDFFTFRNFITWFKPNAMPIMLAKKMGVYAYSCEYINYFSKGNAKFFNYDYLKQINGNKQHRDLIIINNRPHSENVGHPTQKPLKLIKQLIETHSKEKDMVLDLFLGSGTTAVVSEKLNRRWIGIELNPEYCEIAKQRIIKEVKDGNLEKYIP